MAATQGRLTGHAGVCISTLGPGALNFSTGAAYAQLAAMPMILLTGQKAIMSAKQAKFQIVDALRPSCAMRSGWRRKSGRVRSCWSCPKTSRARRWAMLRWCRHIPSSGRSPIRRRSHGLPFFNTQMGKGAVTGCSDLGTAALSAGDYVHRAVDHADLIVSIGHDTIEKPPFPMRPQGPQVLHIGYTSANVEEEVFFPHAEVLGDLGPSLKIVWKGSHVSGPCHSRALLVSTLRGGPMRIRPSRCRQHAISHRSEP